MHHLVIVVLCVLAVNTICQVSTNLSEEARVECNDTIEGRGVEDVEYHAPKESGLPELAGVKGVWWPGSHAISSWWSLLAAGLSSVAIGAAVLPAARRMDTVEDRVFRGVEAEPYAWPWIAKIKVRYPSILIAIAVYIHLDHLPKERGKSAEKSMWRSSYCRQVSI